MSRWILLILAVIVIIAGVLVINLMSTSVPASTSEIETAIRDTRPECRSLVKERLRASIAEHGAISRRQVDTIVHMECTVAGPQYEAAGG
jgi:hypothetical protein